MKTAPAKYARDRGIDEAQINILQSSGLSRKAAPARTPLQYIFK